MPLHLLKRWIASFRYSLPAGFILLHIVTLRWLQCPDMPPGMRDCIYEPLWGFPLPWIWDSGVLSLHSDVSILALMFDTLTYSIPVAALGEFIRSRLPPFSKWPRRIGFALQLGVSGFLGFCLLVGILIGSHTVVPLLPIEPVISICFVPGCYCT